MNNSTITTEQHAAIHSTLSDLLKEQFGFTANGRVEDQRVEALTTTLSAEIAALLEKPRAASDFMPDVAAMIRNRPANFPAHLQDPEFLDRARDPMNHITGGLEVIHMRAWNQIKDTWKRPYTDFTAEIAYEQHLIALRAYDELAQEKGATLQQRIETLEALLREYITQQQRYLTRHGALPNNDTESIEVRSARKVLDEVRNQQ